MKKLICFFILFNSVVASASDLEDRAQAKAAAACGRARVENFKLDLLKTSREGDVRFTPYTYYCQGSTTLRKGIEQEVSPMPVAMSVEPPNVEPRMSFYTVGVAYQSLRYVRDEGIRLFVGTQPAIESNFQVAGLKLGFASLRAMNFGVELNGSLLKAFGQTIQRGTTDLPSFSLFGRVEAAGNFAFTRHLFVSLGLQLLSEIEGSGPFHGGLGGVVGLGWKQDAWLFKIHSQQSSDFTWFDVTSRVTGVGVSIDYVM